MPSSRRARTRPSRASCWRRVGRILTNANSAATKNAFARTITTVRSRATDGCMVREEDRKPPATAQDCGNVPKSCLVVSPFAISALLAGVCTLRLPARARARPPRRCRRRSAEPTTSSPAGCRAPARTRTATSRLVTDGKAATEGAQWDTPGPASVPRHARRHAHLRPRRRAFGVVVPAAGRRQRHLQGLRRDRGHARPRSSCSPRSTAWSTSVTGCARARCASSRPPSATSASASRSATTRTRSRSSRSTARRPTRFRPTCRWSTRPRPRWSRRPGTSSSGSPTTRARASSWASRWSRCVLLIWGIRLEREGRAQYLREAARRLAGVHRRGVVPLLLQLRDVALPEPRSPVGHVPLLRRVEVLQRAVVRPAVRVRRGRRLRGARAAPPRRAAQGDEPAHQHDGGDAAHPRPPRGVQEPLHDAALGRLPKDVAHFRGKHDVKRWEEAQTDHGYNGTPVWNILGTGAVEHRPGVGRPDRLGSPGSIRCSSSG